MTDSAISPPEPTEAFPYTPPTDEIKLKYAHVFEITEPLPRRFFKLAFDKLVAAVLLAFSLPILLLLKIAYVIEGILIPDNKGPMFFLLLGCKWRQENEKVETTLNKDQIY
jgi:lipopolysaccharide/colanic/teichoic acid biosynthesis glycosyltransferase